MGSRRFWGRALLAAGAMLGVAGLILAVAFGPDDRITVGPDDFVSAGPTLATSADAIPWSGPVVEISARRPDGAAVFVGVASHVDVEDYLARTTYTRVDDISLPWDVATSPVVGSRELEAEPGGLGWWVVADEGEGAASVRLPLPDAPVDVVVMDPRLRSGLEVEVTAAWVRDGAFVGGVGLIVIALGLMVIGRRWGRT